MADGKIKHWRGAKADINCVNAGLINAADYKIGEII
jgi:hypothetical protein